MFRLLSISFKCQTGNGLLEDSVKGVEAFLGEGGFGVVAKCRNTITNKFVAIKVNKNAPEIYHQARQEIEILKQLRCLDPETCNIVQWNGYFFLKMNICLNFELLDLSLYHYMEGTPEKTLPITEVKDVLYQLSIALSHLSSIGIVHADLKPDNVMVVDRHQKPLRVKLIDFGLASRVSDCQPGMCVQTTWYRAPEVCLYSEFNEAIDMWSLGLTAAELAVGYPLYPGNMDYDVLSFIIYETGCRPEDTRDFWLSSLDDLEELMEVNRGHNSDHGLLVDLIKKMMHLDQDQRIKPQELLMTDDMLRIILEMTNLNGRQSDPPWKEIDMPCLQAFLRLLILAGVYRSGHEAVASLWDPHTGRGIFSATMSQKQFNLINSNLRFDDGASRTRCRSS
uniref:Protein kinase domain-containing protein n=1 Tax=Labrus bergylta TaxID=56723 RepID=A0A3Q3H1Y8_9LABR